MVAYSLSGKHIAKASLSTADLYRANTVHFCVQFVTGKNSRLAEVKKQVLLYLLQFLKRLSEFQVL